MWGYIGWKKTYIHRDAVPSLYVRVYHLNAYNAGQIICSLIICEGISRNPPPGFLLILFPHYMWGYIGVLKCWEPGKSVPSLYVRVYRRFCLSGAAGLGSLIICEGISEIAVPVRIFRLFPHYMWGYIVNCKRLLWVFLVPSLYVKVYPPGRANGKAELYSLIIYEGISKLAMASFRHQKI